MKLEVPHLTYTDIGKRVHSFLLQYHPSFEIPVPIEEIADVKMGLHIFPFPRLFKDHGQNGFLSRDRTTINVDEYQYEEFYQKCRYTIAHELGHYLLHESCYRNLPFNYPDDYVKWKMSVPAEDIGWFETQGDWFAGQVLVPTNPLVEVCSEVVKKHKKALSKLPRVPDDFWSYAANEIATYFNVNPPVVEIRIKREKIASTIRIE